MVSAGECGMARPGPRGEGRGSVPGAAAVVSVCLQETVPRQNTTNVGQSLHQSPALDLVCEPRARVEGSGPYPVALRRAERAQRQARPYGAADDPRSETAWL